MASKLALVSHDTAAAPDALPCRCESCGHDIAPRPEPIGDDAIARRSLEREGTAYHEAGHLCVGWVLGALLHEGTIKPYGVIGGRAVYGHPAASAGAGVDSVVSILSGRIAELKFNPRAADGTLFDREDVARQLRALCRSEAAAEIVRAECARRAEKLVDENWDAIEAVAAALLQHETLTGDQLDELLADVVADRRNAAEPARRAAMREAMKRAEEFSTANRRADL